MKRPADSFQRRLLSIRVRRGGPCPRIDQCRQAHHSSSFDIGQASFGEAQKPFVEAFASRIVKNVVVPNCGHFVVEEQPEALMTEFSAFFVD